MDDALAALEHSDPDQIVVALMPVLALVGAAGMTQADREEWLHAAVDALRHIPSDLLASAASRARLSCDHPSKVIPFIVKDSAESLAFRRRRLADLQELDAAHHAKSLPAPGKSYCTGQEASEIIANHVPWVHTAETREVKRHDSPPRKPTRSDYLEMGVDPATLDSLGYAA